MLVPFDTTSPDFKLYVTNITGEDFEKVKFEKIVDRFEYIVYLSVLLPDTDPGNYKIFGVKFLPYIL